MVVGLAVKVSGALLGYVMVMDGVAVIVAGVAAGVARHQLI